MNAFGLAALGGALWWLSRINRNPVVRGTRTTMTPDEKYALGPNFPYRVGSWWYDAKPLSRATEARRVGPARSRAYNTVGVYMVQPTGSSGTEWFAVYDETHNRHQVTGRRLVQRVTGTLAQARTYADTKLHTTEPVNKPVVLDHYGKPLPPGTKHWIERKRDEMDRLNMEAADRETRKMWDR